MTDILVFRPLEGGMTMCPVFDLTKWIGRMDECRCPIVPANDIYDDLETMEVHPHVEMAFNPVIRGDLE